MASTLSFTIVSSRESQYEKLFQLKRCFGQMFLLTLAHLNLMLLLNGQNSFVNNVILTRYMGPEIQLSLILLQTYAEKNCDSERTTYCFRSILLIDRIQAYVVPYQY